MTFSAKYKIFQYKENVFLLPVQDNNLLKTVSKRTFNSTSVLEVMRARRFNRCGMCANRKIIFLFSKGTCYDIVKYKRNVHYVQAKTILLNSEA